MLLGRARRVGCLGRDGEVVVDLASVDSSLCLGDQFGPEHGLSVPVGSVIDGKLDTLGGASVGRVLEVW